MLLHPTYFPNVAHFAAMQNEDNLLLEVCDNYQKQTFRNRCDIYGANGKLSLTVPVSYTQKNRQQYKDVKLSKTEHWQSQHLKSLDSAYRMSPFYEFYIDDLMQLFQTEFNFLLDVNLKCLELLSDCLELDFNYQLTESFINPEEAEKDYRILANAKKSLEFNFDSYTQVFTEKHGYLNNLSILDLLFNEGSKYHQLSSSSKTQVIMLQTITHYGIHFILPLIVALIFFKEHWIKACAIMLLSFVIDLDHLLANPIFDTNRCSINFHPLHTYYAMGVYLILAILKPTRLLGIGLLIHIIADAADCAFILS